GSMCSVRRSRRARWHGACPCSRLPSHACWRSFVLSGVNTREFLLLRRLDSGDTMVPTGNTRPRMWRVLRLAQFVSCLPLGTGAHSLIRKPSHPRRALMRARGLSLVRCGPTTSKEESLCALLFALHYAHSWCSADSPARWRSSRIGG